MPLDNTDQPARLIKSSSALPAELEQVVRRYILDKWTGNVQLNIKDGKILGFTENRLHSLTP